MSVSYGRFYFHFLYYEISSHLTVDITQLGRFTKVLFVAVVFPRTKAAFGHST
jgi:hypothetical protein